MSRVHDALRRAEQAGLIPGDTLRQEPGFPPPAPPMVALHEPQTFECQVTPDALAGVEEVEYSPAPESHLLELHSSHETPAEEFRTLRTRLNHLQTLQPLHTVIVSSPSPAEGKTFTTVNLALAEAHLMENRVLLGDFDLRRPVIHNLLQTSRSPGLSDYLTGQCTLTQAMRKIKGMNLYFMPAGSPVRNPLELLNLRSCRQLFEDTPKLFNWSIFDTPPLLFSADANLLATLAHGTILVVKIGSTTYDNVTRAIQSLCENNVLGIVANGARASELYSKYTYYYSKSED